MVDETEKYIKMCSKLPSGIANEHKYEDGDYVYCDFTSDGIVYTKIVCIIGTKWWEGACDPLVWLPTINQLQEISKLDWDLFYHDLVNRYSIYDSVEQAALSMVMYTKHGMKWDGEVWMKTCL